MKIAGVPLICGLLLAFTAMAVTLALTLLFTPASFPAIAYACTVNGLTPPDCLAGARRAGTLGLLAYGIVLLLAGRAGWFSASPAGRPPAPGGESREEGIGAGAASLLAIAVLGIAVPHAGLMAGGPAFASRLDEANAYGIFISLENLALPLLLQVYLTCRSGPMRRVLLAVLLLTMSLSPYRAMLLAMFAFGFLLPLLAGLWTWLRMALPRPPLRPLLSHGCGVAVLGAVLLMSGYIDTEMRSPSLLVQASPPAARAVVLLAADHPDGPRSPSDGGDPVRPPVDISRRLVQRIVFPLYQAAIAGHLAESSEIPGPGDLLLRKFRLGDAPSLEEFLFRRIYGGDGRGETTSLPYGEARAYFPGPPLLWMVLAPLTLILGWRLTARFGMDSGSLFGLAIWRSSFSGLLPILPALLLQTAGLVLLHRLSRPWTRGEGQAKREGRGHILRRFVRASLALLLLLALGVQIWTVAVSMERRSVMLASFTLAPGCRLLSPSWVSIRSDQKIAETGLRVRSVMAAHGAGTVVMALPYAERMAPMLPRVAAGIASLSDCAETSSVRPAEARIVARPINPLDALVILALVLALAALRRAGAPR